MNKNTVKKLLEKIPATVSWSILLFPLIFAWHATVAVAFFLLAFVYLWFFRTLEYIFFLG